jgi:selenocysteine-specific elongation factor
MNLGGVERSDVGRGHVVCHERVARVTERLDAWVEVRPGVRLPLRHHGRVRVHLGTTEVLGKTVLLDEGAGALAPRSKGWVQVVTDEPILALRGDRFILRDETARWTLGGGVVVNPFAARHRRSEGALAPRLEALRAADDAAVAAAFLDLAPEFAVDRLTLGQALNRRDEEIAAAVAPEAIPIPDASAPEAYTTVAKWSRLRDAMLAEVAETHRAHPLHPGIELERLRTQMPVEVSPKVFRWAVDRLVAEQRLVRDESLVRDPAHRVALGAEARSLGDRLERLLTDGRFTPPDLRQLETTTGMSRARLGEVLGVLESERRVVRIAADLYFARGPADEAQALLEAHCRVHGDVTAAAFRDVIGASRKFAIAFLDWCDRTGVTVRVGDLRKLRR